MCDMQSTFSFYFHALVPTVTLNAMGVMVMEGGNQDLCVIISDVPSLGLACAINVTISTTPIGGKGGERADKLLLVRILCALKCTLHGYEICLPECFCLSIHLQ